MLPLDLLAAIPEPRGDEPSSLRADIADELTDHLQCAFRREVLKDGDAAAAQRRTLDCFGDPKKLARRLWWQAMRSRIMKQRIVSGLQWLVALTAMLVSGAVFWQQSQLLAELRQARQEDAVQRQALTAKLDQLQPLTATFGGPINLPPNQDFSLPTYDPAAVASADERSLNYSSTPQSEIPAPNYLPNDPVNVNQLQNPSSQPALSMSFVQETENGGPVCPTSVQLTNSDNVIQPVTGLNNNFAVPSLEPDFYQLSVRLADDQYSERPLLIRDHKPRELMIVCPGPLKRTPVAITMKPLPDDLQKRQFEARLDVWAAPIEIERAKWNTPNLTRQTIKFDAQTGLPTAIDVGRSGSHFNLRDLPPDERRVFLPVGSVSFRFEANQRVEEGGVRVYQWPESQDEETAIKHSVKPDCTTWELELPKEFLEQIQSDITSANYGANALRAE